jgi:hypothetical protein
MEPEWGLDLAIRQFTPEILINLPKNFFAEVPETESLISTHAMHESE